MPDACAFMVDELIISFVKATLLIGKGDWDILAGPKQPPSTRPPGLVVNSEPFVNWISGDGKVEPLLLDKDVFGNGTVVMLNTPGHTPGHHVLLVKLQRSGNVLLSGDLAHVRENYDNNVVPVSIPTAPRPWLRTIASSRSRRTSRQPSLYNTIRATLINCRRFLHPRNSHKWRAQGGRISPYCAMRFAYIIAPYHMPISLVVQNEPRRPRAGVAGLLR